MKKGFTLVELLAVIVILSVISMLVFPNVIKIINQSKENLYQSQLRDIENVAKNFSIEHPELLDANRINATYVTLDALKQSGYLEVDKINNPKNGQEMNGCIKIQYNESNNQYNYNYEEINCSNDATLKGYIITYQNGLNKEERNIVLSAYEKVLSDYNNLISNVEFIKYNDGYCDIISIFNNISSLDFENITLHSDLVNNFKNTPKKLYIKHNEVNEINTKHIYFNQNSLNIISNIDVNDFINLESIVGGTTDGLYDIDDEYIFRGLNPNNYVKLGTGGDSYRIISMNKKDKTIKLIKVTPESSAYSSNNSNSFIESSVATYLLNLITSGSAKDFSNIIVDGIKWKNGILDVNTSVDYNVLKSIEATSTLSNKMGVVQISDYVIASLDDTCYSNILSTTCTTNNYLATLFGSNYVWTMDGSTSGNVITIENGVITNHTLDATTDITYRIYPVMYLKRSVSIKSGNGTSSSPYVIE